MDRWVDFRIILEFRTKSTVPCNEIDWGFKSNSNFNWSSIGNERFSRRNLFHEWTTKRQLSIGSLALIILVIGATLTALHDKKNAAVNAERVSEDWNGGARALILSTLGYLGYTVVVHWANVDTRQWFCRKPSEWF